MREKYAKNLLADKNPKTAVPRFLTMAIKMELLVTNQ